jgi:4a-hydroxytetrahydrobiopterin dehydratase
MERTNFVMPERRKLDDLEIKQHLGQVDGWSVQNGKLHKRFELDSYKAGLVFAMAIGHHADRIDHHPDMFIGYQYVEIGLNTHDVGGISTYDFVLLNLIEGLV